MVNSIRSVTTRFLVFAFVVVLCLGFTGSFGVVHASTEVSGILSSDSTWTKADSPYTLTGPILVSEGVTLIIEEGATVNMNDFRIEVNGTLQMLGTVTEKIHVNNGYRIEFHQFSTVWDEQNGYGCIVKNVVMDSGSLIINGSPKIAENSVYGIDIHDGSPIVSQNTIIGGMTIQGGTPEVEYNTIVGTFYVTGGTSSILHNSIQRRITISSGWATLMYNKFDDGIHADSRGGTITIANNTINANGDYAVIYIQGVPATITNNIITGNNISRATDGDGNSMFDPDSTARYITGGSISAPEGTTDYLVNNDGIKILSSYDCYVSGNSISGCSFAIDGFTSGLLTIEGNVISKNQNGIYLEEKATPFEPFTNSSLIIRNNIVTDNVDIGVQFNHPSPNILSNTITNNYIGIRINKLTDYSTSPTIKNNNIYSNFYNVKNGVTDDINATYNWWGTTDVSAINQSIWDFKNDFYLGKVIFVPFLFEPTSESSEVTPIPEPIPQPDTEPDTVPDNESSSDSDIDVDVDVDVDVSVNDEGDIDVDVDVDVKVSTEPKPKLTISIDSPSEDFGAGVNIFGRLTDENGNPLADKKVTASYSVSNTNWVQIGSCQTNTNGEYTIPWGNTEQGTFTLKAEWNGNEQYNKTRATTTISFLPQTSNNFFIESNSTVTALTFNKTISELTFTVSGPNGTTGYVKATIPKDQQQTEGDWTVLIDNNPITPTINEDTNKTLLLFTYNHSTHTIKIARTTQNQEIPSWIFLPVLLVATLAAIVARKRLTKS